MKAFLFLTLVITTPLGAQRFYPVKDKCLANSCIYDIDNRVVSDDQRVARLIGQRSGFATAFLVSNKCLITAGHAKPNNLRNGKSFIEFDVPNTELKEGLRELNRSIPENRYEIANFSVKGKNKLISGNDWAVFRVKRNILTNKFPGELRGFFELNYQLPEERGKVTTLGFGAEDGQGKNCENSKYATLQASVGDLINVTEKSLWVWQRFIYHNAFTQGGNSGGPILVNGKVIGIHTRGKSYFEPDKKNKILPAQINSGTLFHGNSPLIRAIENCKNI